LPKEKFFDPRKPFQSQRPETHEEWQARMGGEVLAVVRSGLYLDFRFLDMALSALSPAPDERCRVLATDGQTLYYQPQRLLQLYQENPKYLNRLYLHTVFHCVFRHLWLKGRREPQLWSLACDIAVENVIDSLQRKSVVRPLTMCGRTPTGRSPPRKRWWRQPRCTAGSPGRRPACCGSWNGNLSPTTTACGRRMPRSSPSRCPPLCRRNVAEDRGADADRAGSAG